MHAEITQHQIDRTDLVVLAGHDGLAGWPGGTRDVVAAVLRSIADGIGDGTL